VIFLTSFVCLGGGLLLLGAGQGFDRLSMGKPVENWVK